MKKIHRVLALLMAALMALGLMTTAFAATDSAPTIDPSKKASLSIYKYDITKASNDGAWDVESYSAVAEELLPSVPSVFQGTDGFEE